MVQRFRGLGFIGSLQGFMGLVIGIYRACRMLSASSWASGDQSSAIAVPRLGSHGLPTCLSGRTSL